MKSLLISIFLWSSIMAQEIVPYPFPNYDEDLIAKEIVNGSYMASINMLIRNSQTGEERYVHVPNSPKVISDAEKTLPNGNPRPERYDQNMSIYDRDKILEDAVLPKYVDIGENLPEFVSRSMCPQGLEFIAQKDESYFKVGSFFQNGEYYFLSVEKTDDGQSSTNFIDDVYTFYLYNGDTKTKMFDFKESDNNTVPLFVYSIDGRNFMVAIGKVYEIFDSGFSLISDIKISGIHSFVAKEKGDFFLVANNGATAKTQNIFTGEVKESQVTQYASSGNSLKLSAYKSNFYHADSLHFYIEDGYVRDNLTPAKYHRATRKVRFDYHDEIYPTKYNLKNGVPNHPKSRSPSGELTFLGNKNGVVAVGTDGNIYYTNNFQDYIDTGIYIGANDAKVVVSESYIYFNRYGKLIVMKPTSWAYERPPRGDYAEMYAKEFMLDHQHDEPYLDY